MQKRIRLPVRATLLLAFIALVLPHGPALSGRQAQLKITGPDGKTLVVSPKDLKTMPRMTVTIVNPRS
jgi:hypothetical protein